MDILDKAELILERKKAIIKRELTELEESVMLFDIIKGLRVSDLTLKSNLRK